MNFQESTIKIFQSAYGRLTHFQGLIKNHTPIIAFSGGKDSTILAQFYKYLFLNSLCPEPILFHLDHSIRNNLQQENEIKLEMKKNFKKTVSKKKTFQHLLEDLKKV